MKKIFFLVFLFSLPLILFSQNYTSCLFKLTVNEDFKKTPSIIAKWEKMEPDNGDKYIELYRFYKEQFFVDFSDADTIYNLDSFFANLNITDSLSGEYCFKRAYDVLNEGISKNPNRLDLYWAKVEFFGDNGLYYLFTNEILKLIDYNINKRPLWLTYNDKFINNQKDVFENRISDFIIGLSYKEKPSLETMEYLSNLMIKFFPENLTYKWNIGYCCMLRDDWEKAVELFGYVYERMDNKQYAIDFFVKFSVTLCLADSYYSCGQLNSAEKYYSRFLDEPNSKYMRLYDNRKERLKEIKLKLKKN